MLQKILASVLNRIKRFCSSRWYDVIGLLKQKKILIVWLFVNVMFMHAQFLGSLSFNYYYSRKFWNIMIIFYGLIFVFLFSNLVDKIMIAISDARHVATKSEKERILPIFNEVYNKIQKIDKSVNKNIKLYIIDSAKINASVIAPHTICIERGLLETMDDNELKAILTHEFAHIMYRDIHMSLLVTYGTNIFIWFFSILNLLVEFIAQLFASNAIIRFIFGILSSILKALIEISLMIWNIVLAPFMRLQEYRADRLAYDLDYALYMLSALYKLYDMQIKDQKKLISRLTISHPRVAYRIEKIENLIKEQE